MARKIISKVKEPQNGPRMTTQLVLDKKPDNNVEERKRALAFKRIEEVLMQNVSKNSNKTFTQYTKSLIKQYLQNPYNYKDSIREVSRYLFRVSTLYKKIVLYYATMFLYNYNVIYKSDFTKEIDAQKALKKYQTFLKRMQAIDLQKEAVSIIATAIRDGIYCGFVYDNEEEGFFVHMLDPKYYKIRGKNADGQWIVYFDATYFSSGSNKEFVEGIDGDMSGTWDDVFVDGWNYYQEDTTNNRWFMLPPEKTICLIANLDDEFDMPLPFFVGSFTSLLDCLDYEQLIADKTALENYALLVTKIPLISGSQQVDDLAVSLELVQAAQELIDAAVPDLVGTAWLPGMDVEPITFKPNDTASDTDVLSQSIENVFTQTGASQIVVSGGKSSNSVGLKHAIENDTSTAYIWVERLQSNLQYYIKANISEEFIFKFHKETWYNREDYITQMKDAATLGGDAMDYFTALGMTPYEAYCKLRFEKAIGLKEMMVPIQTSYTQSSSEGGRPQSDDDDLSAEGIATRDGDKHNNG